MSAPTAKQVNAQLDIFERCLQRMACAHGALYDDLQVKRDQVAQGLLPDEETYKALCSAVQAMEALTDQGGGA